MEELMKVPDSVIIKSLQDEVKTLRKKFTNLKNRREIMDAMAFAYNEEMPIAYNVVVFLEWVRVSGKWEELSARMFNVYTESR